jgi:hypothetical protein
MRIDDVLNLITVDPSDADSPPLQWFTPDTPKDEQEQKRQLSGRHCYCIVSGSRFNPSPGKNWQIRRLNLTLYQPPEGGEPQADDTELWNLYHFFMYVLPKHVNIAPFDAPHRGEVTSVSLPSSGTEYSEKFKGRFVRLQYQQLFRVL